MDATGKLTIRADSGFWSHKVMDACVAHGVDFSITVARQKPIMAAVEAIADDAWIDIAYTAGGVAQVAETDFGRYRLIVRRTKITDDPDAMRLFPTGATTRSSPTAPATRSSSTSTTVPTPWSSSPSVT